MRKAFFYFTWVGLCAAQMLDSAVVEPAKKLRAAAPAEQATAIDTTFQFGETNVTDIRDLKLFSDGRIVFGGVGRFKSVGIASTDGAVPENYSWGGDLTNR